MSTKGLPIQFVNRETGNVEIEHVYGERFLRFTYETGMGRFFRDFFVKKALFSRYFGKKMSAPESQKKIRPFIEEYGLKEDDFLDAADSFSSFNEFFYRKLKPKARPIDQDEKTIIFPADGRHLGFQQASQIGHVFVKGQRFKISQLIGDVEIARKFAHGSVVLSRLCPVDYHRFHFPVAGIPCEARLVNGELFSVSPIALRRRLDYLWENKRFVTIIETESFGSVAMIEIGATCVGSILQTYVPGQTVSKGQEKGYFAFGGSSVMLVFEPERIELAEDLLDATARGYELYARVGTVLGKKPSEFVEPSTNQIGARFRL